MIAADIMSRPVIVVSADAPLVEAVRLMIENRISGVPVVDRANRPVGMLTEGDLLRRVETGTESSAPGWFASFFMASRLAGEYVQTHGRRTGQIMTSDVTSVEESTPLSDVVQLMQQRRIKRVPVVREGKVVGIVSRADLMRVVGKALEVPAATADDATIRQTILDGLARQPWGQTTQVDVTVENGVVQLNGCVYDLLQRAAMGVLADNVPGVRRVENRLVCIELNTGTVIFDPND